MSMNDAQIKHMVDRFLAWKLPEHFRPDCGISFDADAARKLNPLNHRYEPSGTNLFDATQAEAMIRYLVEGLPTEPGLVVPASHPLAGEPGVVVSRPLPEKMP